MHRPDPATFRFVGEADWWHSGDLSFRRGHRLQFWIRQPSILSLQKTCRGCLHEWGSGEPDSRSGDEARQTCTSHFVEISGNKSLHV